MIHRWRTCSDRGVTLGGGRRRSHIALLILGMAFMTVPAFGQSNPFLSPAPREPGPSSQDTPMMDHGPTASPRSTDSLRWGDGAVGRVWASTRTVLVRWQRDLNRSLGLRLRSVAANDHGALGALGALGFAFAFGFLHAVLPGHRKSVLISYCVADRARIVHGVALGFLFAVMHALSAVLIVMVITALFEVAIGSTIAQISRVTQILSSVLLIGIGVIFCYFSVREIRSHTRSDDRGTGNIDGSIPPDNQHGHCKHHGHDAMYSKQTDVRMRRWVPVVLSTGIIPCPITTALMLFAVSINAVGLGVAAVAALSAGLGLALAFLAVVTIVIKGRIISLLEHKVGHVLHIGVELLGGVMILAVGMLTLAVLM